MTAAVFTLTMPLARIHNSNDRGHWSIASRQRAEMRAAAKKAAWTLPAIPGKVTLTITFAFPDKRARDLDNWSVKGAIDGAVDAGVLSDDRANVLVSVTRVAGGKSPKGYAVMTFAFSPVAGESHEKGAAVLKSEGKRKTPPAGNRGLTAETVRGHIG